PIGVVASVQDQSLALAIGGHRSVGGLSPPKEGKNQDVAGADVVDGATGGALAVAVVAGECWGGDGRRVRAGRTNCHSLIPYRGCRSWWTGKDDHRLSARSRSDCVFRRGRDMYRVESFSFIGAVGSTAPSVEQIIGDARVKGGDSQGRAAETHLGYRFHGVA